MLETLVRTQNKNEQILERLRKAEGLWCKYTMWGTVSRWGTLGLCSEHCIPDLRRSLVFDA
jgi:hypothetical protein